ncbi:MAG: phage tail protein [Oscillospiraceae bacterium]|nr:phage tail protein [Oscillospiraceae bacterium]
MKPILYAPEERDFVNNGIGILTDAVSSYVTRSRNNEYELEMEYPIDGIHYDEITDNMIILAKPSPTKQPQPFRVNFKSAPMDGIVRILAHHAIYDLAGVPVDPFTVESAPAAMAALKTNEVIDSGFSYWTDILTEATMTVTQPAPIWNVLGGILDTYGGEYEFDRFAVKLHANLGMDRGVTLRYGKNITDLRQERNCSAVYTAVYPFWRGSDGTMVRLPERLVNAPGTYSFSKILTLDASTAFQQAPTEDQLRSYTESYISSNNIGVPAVSITVSFIPLEQTEEYKHLALLERVELCDTVTVELPKMGIFTSAKCVKTVYDVLADRYQSIDIGSVRANIADTIVQHQQAIDKVQSPSFLQQAADRATNWILNGKGYMVAVRDAAGNWQEICSLDTPDIEAAVNVWRWNNGGLAHSANGYNGPFNIAITQDGRIVADFITVGTLDAALVKIKNLIADHVKSILGNSTLEINGASLSMYYDGTETFSVYNWDDGTSAVYMRRSYEDGGEDNAHFRADLISVGGNINNPAVSLFANREGNAHLYMASDGKAKQLSWRDNGNGTFTLIGTEV